VPGSVGDIRQLPVPRGNAPSRRLDDPFRAAGAPTLLKPWDRVKALIPENAGLLPAGIKRSRAGTATRPFGASVADIQINAGPIHCDVVLVVVVFLAQVWALHYFPE